MYAGFSDKGECGVGTQVTIKASETYISVQQYIHDLFGPLRSIQGQK